MSSQDNNHGPEMMFGGLLLIVIVFGVLMKAITKLFEQLALTFQSFGHMAESFVGMLWHIFQVVGLISLNAFAAFAAVYFTVKYYQMVKTGTDLKKYLDGVMEHHDREMQKRIEAFETQVSGKINDMREELDNALKEPEVSPESPGVGAVTQGQANESATLENRNVGYETNESSSDIESEENDSEYDSDGSENYEEGTDNEESTNQLVSNPL